MDYLSPFVLALVIAFVSTPLISRIALRNGLVDQPGRHKLHHEAKPLLGGVGIFLACLIALLVYLPVSERLASVLIAGAILVIIGVVDDIHNLKPLTKLMGQLVVAAVVVLPNTSAYSVLLEYFEQLHIPQQLTLGLIIGWIVLMINAINLIDGLDGLAAGTAAIIFGAMALITFINGGGYLMAAQLIGLGLPFTHK